MRKILIAAALAVACAGAAYADAFASPFYVAIDRASGRCVMMQFMGAGAPDTHRYKVMGSFKSMKAAHKAMTHMASCH